jgi:hypothetical protein
MKKIYVPKNKLLEIHSGGCGYVNGCKVAYVSFIVGNNVKGISLAVVEHVGLNGNVLSLRSLQSTMMILDDEINVLDTFCEDFYDINPSGLLIKVFH